MGLKFSRQMMVSPLLKMPQEWGVLEQDINGFVKRLFMGFVQIVQKVFAL
jgi:hypothetical protein